MAQPPPQMCPSPPGERAETFTAGLRSLARPDDLLPAAVAPGRPTLDVPRFLVPQCRDRVAATLACARCLAPLGLRFAKDDAALYKHRLADFPSASPTRFAAALLLKEADQRNATAFDLSDDAGHRLRLRLQSWGGHGADLDGGPTAVLAPRLTCAFRDAAPKADDPPLTKLALDADDLAALTAALNEAHVRAPDAAAAPDSWKLATLDR